VKLRLCLAWPKFNLILPLFFFLYFDNKRGQIEKRIKKEGQIELNKRHVCDRRYFFFGEG